MTAFRFADLTEKTAASLTLDELLGLFASIVGPNQEEDSTILPIMMPLRVETEYGLLYIG